MKKLKIIKVGQVHTTKIEGKTISKRLTKEESEKLFKQAELYNKSNSERSLAAMKKILTPAADKAKIAKDKEVAVLKGKKKLVKKEIKKVSKTKSAKVGNSEEQLLKQIKDNVEKGGEDFLNKMKELLGISTQVAKEEPKAQESPNKRSGEY